MTSTTNILAKVEAAIKASETTDECPTDLYVTQIYDTISKIFYPIRYDIVGAKHNLMGLVDEDTSYATEYSESFHRPERPVIYASDIDSRKDASLDNRRKEAVHKARISYWEIYDVTKSGANRFIVCVLEDVWISPLSKGGPMFYKKKTTKDLLD